MRFTARGHSLHVGIGGHGFGILELALGLAPFADGFDQGTEIGVFLGGRDELLRIETAAGQGGLQFGVASGDLIEFLKQRHGIALVTQIHRMTQCTGNKTVMERIL